MARRPNKHSPEVIQAVVDKLYPKCLAWLKALGDDCNEESAKEELTEALNNGFDWDGYALAQRLDDWSPDAGLVEILDEASYLSFKPLKNLEREYAKTLMPKYKVGDTIKLPREGVEGEITSIESSGHYHIYSPDLGHIRPGEGSGTLAVVYRWEDLDVDKANT